MFNTFVDRMNIMPKADQYARVAILTDFQIIYLGFNDIHSVPDFSQQL